MSTHYHPFHLVDPSPWPYVGASGALATTFGSVIYFHYSQTSLLIVGFVLLTVTFIF